METLFLPLDEDERDREEERDFLKKERKKKVTQKVRGNCCFFCSICSHLERDLKS